MSGAMERGLIERAEIVMPARLFIYYHARTWNGDQGRDRGTFPRDAIKSMRRVGMPDEKHWPFWVSRTNKPPPWRAYKHAHDRRAPSAYYRIFDGEDGRVDAIIAALHAQNFVIFGTQFDFAFTSDVGPMIVGKPNGDLQGGHAMAIVGYYRDPTAGLVFEVVNSWGENYRDGGYVYLTEEYIRWALSRDFWVMAV